MILQLPKRPRIEVTDCAKRRIWQDRTGRFRLVHTHSLFGLSDQWLAMQYCEEYRCWDIVSKHHVRGPAQKALQKLAKQVGD